MTELKKTMTWGEPAAETKSNGTAAATKVNTLSLTEESDFNWDLVDFLSSQEFVPAPVPSPISPSLPRIDDFKQRQKEELEKFLQQQKEAEEAFLLEQQQREEEETRRKQQEEEEAVEKKASPGEKEISETQTVTILLDILAELRSLKEMYQTSLLRPKRKRPSRAKQPIPVTTPEIPALVISTPSLTRGSSQVGLGRGKGIKQLKRIASRS
jgi:hypothetical protein